MSVLFTGSTGVKFVNALNKLGLGDCVNFNIMIIVIKTSRFSIISDFVKIWKYKYINHVYYASLLIIHIIIWIVTNLA